MISGAKKYVAVLLFFVCMCVIFFSQTAYAAEDSSQHETVKVGFFAMDGYHMMDEEGNRSGYGWDTLRLMARYWDVNYEYIGYDKSWGEMQQMLEDGEIDMVTSARKTPEREEKFDFSKPIGSNQCMVTVRNDNNKIVDQDYSTYNGMRVALLNGNSRNNDFDSFARERGFTYTPVYFDIISDMEEALEAGSVDAIVSSSMRATQDEHVIEKFASTDIYVIVKKGNTKLLNEINYAIDQVNAAEGDWKTELFNRYYTSVNEKNLEYTDGEMEIIEQYSSKDSPLMVLCDPTRYPYSYVEDGEMKGILPDYFRKLAEYAGVSYKFIISQSREEYQKYQADKEHVDLCIDARIETDNYAELKEWGLSVPYIDMRMAKVMRRDFSGNIEKVACVDQGASKTIEDVLAPGAEKVICDTRTDAMEAVKTGKADIAFVYYYMAQAFVNNDASGTMAYSMMDAPVYQYRILVASKNNHALAGIFTKAIYAMPDNTIEDIAAGYTSYKASDMTVSTYVQIHPISSLMLCIFIAWILVTLVILWSRIKTRKKLQFITQQKAEEMAELAEHAQAANKAKTAFLSHMSHDMRTPMNAIIGFTGIAMKNNPSDEVRNCLEKINESSEHLLSLINDVLDLTRVESGKMKYSPVPADVKSITDSALDITKGFLTNRDINFKIRREEAKIPNVLADPVHLRDVLVNILSNAVKFTPDGGTITFEAHCQENGEDGYINMHYRISDTGIGMSEEFTKEIFEEFAQEDSGARTQYHGAGLGMAIVKKYVDMMGGTISVQSKKNEGTTFTVDIPLEITDKGCSKQNTSLSEKINLTGVSVLLAEDNELNAEIAAVQLEEFGMNVERAVDGKNAVEIFKNHPKGTFDVILMDIMMPEMNGYEAAKAIRAMNDRPDGKTIPIIAMTANSFAEDVQASLEAGMNAHLSKPIVIDEVIKTILKYVH